MAEFVRIGSEGHRWSDLVADWRSQTEDMGEIFDEEYQLQPDIFLPLIDRDDPKAGLFAVWDAGHYEAICQLNTTTLPGYKAPVLRVRHVTFAPRVDLGGDVERYSDVLVETFAAVLRLSVQGGAMQAPHMNFHLPSPADRQFFTFLGKSLMSSKIFTSVDSKGAWLYITI